MKKLVLLALPTLFLISSFRAQNALHFDGSNDYVQTTFPGILGTNNRTFEAWVKVDAGAPSTNLCILDYGSAAAQSRNTLSIGASRNLAFIAGGTNTNMSSGTNTITVGQWNHVAFVLENGTGYMYINGSLVGTGNLSNVTTPSGGTNLRIGERVSGGTIPFEGSIDEVRIWDVARSATEIANNRNAEFCTVPEHLVAYYTFNQGAASGNNAGLTNLHNAVQNANGTLTNFSLSGSTSNWVSGAPITAGLTVSKNTASACDSLISPSGLYTWTSSGNYYDTLPNANNCDSIMRFALTVNNSIYDVVNDTSCDPYTSPSGKYTFTSSGKYFDTTLTSNGCLHVHELNLQLDIIDTSVSISASQISSNQSGANYKWVDCNNDFLPVSGGTGQSFTPTANGDYAVIVELGHCIDTSACVGFKHVGISEHSGHAIELYPNPVNNILYLTFTGNVKNAHYEILSSTGQVVLRGIIEDQIDVSPLEGGLYWVKVIGERDILSNTFIKE